MTLDGFVKIAVHEGRDLAGSPRPSRPLYVIGIPNCQAYLHARHKLCAYGTRTVPKLIQR